MMTLHILKLLHVFLGTLFFGCLLFSFVFLWQAIKTRDHQQLLSSLKFSFFLDGLLLMIVVSQFLTGTLLVPKTVYSFKTPWIDAAYFLLASTAILFILSVLIKIKNYQLIIKQSQFSFRFLKTYIICYFFMILMIIFVIRDAILKSTLL